MIFGTAKTKMDYQYGTEGVYWKKDFKYVTKWSGTHGKESRYTSHVIKVPWIYDLGVDDKRDAYN